MSALYTAANTMLQPYGTLTSPWLARIHPRTTPTACDGVLAAGAGTRGPTGCFRRLILITALWVTTSYLAPAFADPWRLYSDRSIASAQPYIRQFPIKATSDPIPLSSHRPTSVCLLDKNAYNNVHAITPDAEGQGDKLNGMHAGQFI